MSVHISELYRQIYRRLDQLTPLPFDCGTMCDKRCCQGDDESGMYLFPGEARLFQEKENFSVLPTELLAGKRKVQLLICHGPCRRGERPLSCRIFPLVPLYRKGCTLRIIPDPRAAFCPLTHPVAMGYISPEFIRQVRYAFRVLLKIPAVREFLDTLSYLLEDYRHLKP